MITYFIFFMTLFYIYLFYINIYLFYFYVLFYDFMITYEHLFISLLIIAIFSFVKDQYQPSAHFYWVFGYLSVYY